MTSATRGREISLFDPSRHEPLRATPWDEDRVRATVARIVEDCERRFTPERFWPPHPRDSTGQLAPDAFGTSLYDGACGVIWALHYLEARGAVRLSRDYRDHLDLLLARNRAELGDAERRASLLNGEVPIRLLQHGRGPSRALEDALDALIAGNVEHPARELMYGSPGTMLAALFLHERTRDPRWAALYRRTASRLRSQLEWSDECACHYWTQVMGGWTTTYLGAVHGFVATALPLIRGRHLLDAPAWSDWERIIAGTVARTALVANDRANWPALLFLEKAWQDKRLMQLCHGAPGFVVCLAGFPGPALDALLLAAGEAIWAAGPLVKGANLCHGTGGNGYAFLKLWTRTRDSFWLDRARAFAMHAIEQMQDDAARFGHLHPSLWTGDAGFAIYLWDCVQATSRFPTLDVFYADVA